jgi:hypothetical protein
MDGGGGNWARLQVVTRDILPKGVDVYKLPFWTIHLPKMLNLGFSLIFFG